MKKRVLLTGATGFIGRALLVAMVEQSFDVTALVRARDTLSARRRLGLLGLHPRVGVVVGDLEKPRFGIRSEDWHSTGVVVHAAAMPKLAGGREAAMRRLHVDAIRELSEAVQEFGVARVFHLSTAFVRPGGNGVLAEGPAGNGNGANLYETTKTIGEHLLAEKLGDRLEILRPGIVVPGMGDGVEEIAASPLGTFFRAIQLLGGRRLLLPGEARISPGFVTLHDVVAFTMARLNASKKKAHTWNLVHQTAPTMGEMVEAWNACDDLPRVRLVGNRGGAGFRAWAPYLCTQRLWDVSKTRAEAERAGISWREVSPVLFGRLFERWRQHERQEGAA